MSDSTATANPPEWAPWRGLLQWSPFKIDALGLVTLLGAEEINASVGRLVRSQLLEYFPLLGAFVIAGNAFRNKQAGFNLYNITQGIHTTDLAAWLTRWMSSQKFESNRSFVRWTVEPIKVPFREKLLGMSLPFFGNGMLLAMTVLSYDWYGFANAIAMFLSIVVRCYMVSSVRNAIDKRVKEAYDKLEPHQHTTFADAMHDWEVKNKQAKASVNGGDSEAKPCLNSRPHHLSPHIGWNGTESAKVLIIMNDAKAVTMMIPRDLLAPPSVFIANLEPLNRPLYGIMRWLGWIAFAVQVITIGMADLATQIVTVALLVIPTVLFVARLGCDDSRWWKNSRSFICRNLPKRTRDQIPQPYDYGRDWPELQSVSWIGSMLKAEVYEWPWSHEFPHDAKGPKGNVDVPALKGDSHYDYNLERPVSKRQWLYAWLQMSGEEQESMDKWDLFPHKRGNNQVWLDVFALMTKRTERLQKRTWSIKSLVGTPKVTPATTATTAPLQHSTQEPKLPKLDTRLPKYHHGTKPIKVEEEQDTADTAQDGTALSPGSLSTSPGGITSPTTGHRTSVAFTPSAEDRREGIEAPKRASTEPPIRGRRHSMASAVPTSSAFWLTSQINQQKQDGEATSESDDTLLGRRPEAGGGSDDIGDMH